MHSTLLPSIKKIIFYIHIYLYIRGKNLIYWCIRSNNNNFWSSRLFGWHSGQVGRCRQHAMLLSHVKVVGNAIMVARSLKLDFCGKNDYSWDPYFYVLLLFLLILSLQGFQEELAQRKGKLSTYISVVTSLTHLIYFLFCYHFSLGSVQRLPNSLPSIYTKARILWWW